MKYTRTPADSPACLQRRALLKALGALATLPLAPPDTFARAVCDPFALGVASGDPARDGFVLWTRLVGPGGTLLEAGDAVVRFEIAQDPAFRHIVQAGHVVAQRVHGHSVHLEVSALRPGRPYWYRFHALGASSDIGQTCTVPMHADHLRLALISCQHWELGWFGAYRALLAAEPDLIVQVGDYIYETSYPAQPMVRRFSAPDPLDLSGYRMRHALYRSDAELRAAHRAVPWLVTWDDHEVLNDYANLANLDGLPAAAFARRRAAAYQAYFEHMPIRPSLWRQGPGVRLYRGIDWADLASVSVLDTRQYRSRPACSTGNIARNTRVTDCADSDSPGRSILGVAQEDWISARLENETRPWTVIAQQVFFAPLALDGGAHSFYSDQWDGYAANRQRLSRLLAQPAVRNAVVLSGDIHSFWANELREDWRNGNSRRIGCELVTSALAAQPPPQGRFGEACANNPHIRYSELTHSGYTLIDFDRQRLQAGMFSVDRTRPDSAAQPLVTLVQGNGAGGLEVERAG